MYIMKKGILQVVEMILDLLSREKELSIKRISKIIKCEWRTTAKALEFMKRIELVSERKGKKGFKEGVLFLQ